MDTRTIMGALGLGRLALGSALLVTPRRLVGPIWFGPEAGRGTNAAASRAIGIRDVILGLGIAEAAFRGRPLGRWIVIGGVTDALDTGVTFTSGPAVPVRSRVVVGSVVGGAAVVQTLLLAAARRRSSAR